jgi:hypothetical protein
MKLYLINPSLAGTLHYYYFRVPILLLWYLLFCIEVIVRNYFNFILWVTICIVLRANILYMGLTKSWPCVNFPLTILNKLQRNAHRVKCCLVSLWVRFIFMQQSDKFCTYTIFRASFQNPAFSACLNMVCVNYNNLDFI